MRFIPNLFVELSQLFYADNSRRRSMTSTPIRTGTERKEQFIIRFGTNFRHQRKRWDFLFLEEGFAIFLFFSPFYLFFGDFPLPQILFAKCVEVDLLASFATKNRIWISREFWGFSFLLGVWKFQSKCGFKLENGFYRNSLKPRWKAVVFLVYSKYKNKHSLHYQTSKNIKWKLIKSLNLSIFKK